jgi:hypothetical protein
MLEKEAVLSQCEGKIRAYEGTSKEQHEAVNRVRVLERDLVSSR